MAATEKPSGLLSNEARQIDLVSNPAQIDQS